MSGGRSSTQRRHHTSTRLSIQQIPVDRIRPEDGLGRKRGREGHRELCRSIEQFGVLTPITVRQAQDGSEDFLLIKGQGRTLACRLLGIEKIPALVVGHKYTETEKVQQFLVENVARIKMRAVDRALLISYARREGEETAAVAKRFGVSPATVRRLEFQLDGASSGEVAALRAGDLNLALHAIIAKHVPPDERAELVGRVARYGIPAGLMDALLRAIGWKALVELGPRFRAQRLLLLEWACRVIAVQRKGSTRDRIRQLAFELPLSLSADLMVGSEVAG